MDFWKCCQKFQKIILFNPLTAPALGTIAARGITNKKDAINVSEEIDEDIFEVGWIFW